MAKNDCSFVADQEESMNNLRFIEYRVNEMIYLGPLGIRK